MTAEHTIATNVKDIVITQLTLPHILLKSPMVNFIVDMNRHLNQLQIELKLSQSQRNDLDK